MARIFIPKSYSRESLGDLFISMLGDFSDSESPKITKNVGLPVP